MKCVLSAMMFLGMLGADAAPPTDDAPTYDLKEKVEVGSQVQTKFHLVIRGKIQAGDKEEAELAGQALLEFTDRALEVGKDGMPKRVARFYTDARAKFVVGNTGDPRRLRAPVRFMVGERTEDGFELWSPGGPLTSDERELVEDVMDTTRLTGLLPQSEVAVGETWQPNPDVVLGLCDLDNFIESTIECKLESVDANKATIKVTGATNGLALSTEVKQKVEVTLVYDLEARLIEEVTWHQADNRGASPISPAGSFQVKMSITRAHAPSENLSDAALAGITLLPNPAAKLLVFQDPEGAYRFYHDRSWHMTMLNSTRAVFRRLSSGQFLAQLNVTEMNQVPGEAKTSARHVQEMIETSAGIDVDEVIKVENLPTDGSFDLQLLLARGKSGAEELEQRHYIATGKSGRQVVFSFSIEPEHVPAMGTTDLALVTSLDLPENTAALPESIKK